jgi:hypothetical protein
MLMTATKTALKSYAGQRNSRFDNANSKIITPAQRWKDAYNAYDAGSRATIDRVLDGSKDEFCRRNSHIKTWADMDLCESSLVALDKILIDSTMQRQLDIFWVMKLVNKYRSLMVMPIQVYVDDQGNHLAWDGQHTLIMLWIIATQILALDTSTVQVPVVRYKSKLKSEMRGNFISLNSSDGKKSLDPIDIFEQQVFGVRIDGSSDPAWKESETKQTHAETYDLFLTAGKFGDTHMPGAIGRLNEVQKLTTECTRWLMRYLSHTTQGQRPAEEKEMVMMGQFFYRCKAANIKVDDAYIDELARLNMRLFGGDFDPHGRFWAKARAAYFSWHQRQQDLGFIEQGVNPRFSNEPLHGMPFLLAQLNKDFKRTVPSNTSNSPFYPAPKDLF